jgi:K+-transporting ATPase ATPase A chain
VPSHRLCGIDPDREQGWPEYVGSLLVFSAMGLLVTYAIQRLQHLLPLNPQGLPAVEPGLAFNTAVSFTTNTNWQSYVGETTMSYLTQMAGLAWHNFTSAATGIAVAAALARGLTGRRIGSFWADVVRSLVHVLLPLSAVLRRVLAVAGRDPEPRRVPRGRDLDGGSQDAGDGAGRLQEAIKQLGTNGGGFFNANARIPSRTRRR